MSVEDLLKLDPDCRDVALYDIADDVLINMEVGVGEDHSCPDDLAPWNIGMRHPKLVGEMGRRLAENFHPSLSRCLNHRIRCEY